MKTRKQKKMKKKLKKVLKVLEIIVKLAIIGLSIYVFINRLQDVKSIDFFFTTWR